jgi:signal transduction histidine kinase
MLQFLDKTKDVMLQKHIADNKFLQIINAFVSHELRNPLNSITSQNN